MRHHLISCAVTILLLGVGCARKEGPPPKARAVASSQGLDAAGKPQPTTDDRCAMCGMRVVDHREWVGAIVLDDGATHYFCSVRCTLATARHSDKFLGAATSRIKSVRVPDFLHPERYLDADAALFVTGSDVRGPMGLELVPAASQEDADVVLRRHGGKIVRRTDVDDKLLMELKKHSMGAPSPTQ